MPSRGVRPSVTFVSSVEMSKGIFEIFHYRVATPFYTIRDKARQWSKFATFSCPTCIRRSYQGVCRIVYGIEKLKWQRVKKFENTITRFHTIRERDRRTDRQTDGQTDRQTD